VSGKPGRWDELTADEKRTLRLEAWVRGDGIQFDSPEARSKYVERTTLLRDAWELKKTPARVPIAGLGGGYIITTGTQIDDGQEETIRAMVDFTKEYGVY